jgi:DNA-directed RNA polymerase specialized sigma24 family protein
MLILDCPIVFKKLRYQFFKSISENEANDIVQDAFLKIYTTSSLPASFEALPSWVCKLVKNNALDLFKKAYVINELDEYGISRYDYIGDDQEVESATLSALDISEDAIRNCVFIGKNGSIKGFNNQINREVEGCMTESMKVFGLNHPQRNVAISMLMDGKPVMDIALTLGKTVSATWVYIHESKKKLTPFIKNCLELLD